MKMQAKFLECKFEQKPDSAFLVEYQRAILLTLLQDGLLTQEQLEECVCRLKCQKK